MKSVKKKSPNLRFPNFQESWFTSKIGDSCNVLMCKRIFADQTSETEKIPFYKIGTIGGTPDAFISEELFTSYKRKYNYPKEGEILITCSGTVGKCIPFNGNDAYFQDSNIVWLDNPSSIIKNELLYYILGKVNWGKLNSTTISRIYGSDLRNLKITYPDNSEEQKKIATFLSSVDIKIEQLQKKKQLLEQYKKGIMQKIFKQEIRFKDENGNNFPEWREKKLGDIATIQMGQSPDSKSYNSEGKGVSLIQGNADIKERKSEPRIYTTQPTKICEINDILLTVRAPVGSVAISHHKACLGRGVCSLKHNSQSIQGFIYQFLLKYEPKWIRLSQGSTFSAVSGKDIKTLHIRVPSIEEQTKIANFLSAIDVKINLVITEIEKANQFKKGLLQQMFV